MLGEKGSLSVKAEATTTPPFSTIIGAFFLPPATAFPAVKVAISANVFAPSSSVGRRGETWEPVLVFP